MTIAPAAVPTAVVTEWLGITAQALGDLAKRGVVPKAGRDKWSLKAVVVAYTEHMREVAAGRRGDAAEALDLVQERAQLARAQREHQDMKNAELAGRLLPAEQVNAAVADAFARVRSHLLRLPMKATSRARDLTGPAEIRTVLDGLVRDALDELADTDVTVKPEAAADD